MTLKHCNRIWTRRNFFKAVIVSVIGRSMGKLHLYSWQWFYLSRRVTWEVETTVDGSYIVALTFHTRLSSQEVRAGSTPTR